MIRVAHSADWHVDPQNFDQTLPAIDHMIDGIEERKPDLIVVAGDLFVKRGYLDPTATHHVRGRFRRLASIAPTVVIPGNHDEQNAFDTKDSVLGALDMTDTDKGLFIMTRPEHLLLALGSGETIQVCALPTPNKYFYLSQAEDTADAKAAISEKLGAVVRGMIAELDPSIPSILVYHGSVVGGQGDSEMLMTTGIDIAVDRGIVGDAFTGILCGHLHRPQEVGRWVYCGSPAPLTFAMEKVQPSWCLWSIENGAATFERIPIPIAHQLLTLEVKEASGALQVDWNEDTIRGTKLKIVGKVSEHLWDSDIEEALRKRVLDAGADSVRFQVERMRPSSIRMEEARGDQDIRSLLVKWVVMNEEFRPLFDDLLELSDTVEAKIPASARLHQAGSDYRPQRVKWSNFKQYAHGEIDFTNRALGRLVCITGSNFSGKSNAAEVEAFTLYKHLRGSSKIEDVVRNGEKLCETSVEFEAGQELWRVVRTVKRSGNGAAAGDVRLERNMLEHEGDDRWIPQNAGTSHETERKIQEIVGPPELYFATRYRSQFDVDRLLNMRPSELKDTLQLAVNTSLFDRREEIAKGIQRKAEQAQSIAAAKLETLEKQIAQAAGIEDAFITTTEERAEAENAVTVREARLTTIDQEMQGKRGEIQKLEARRAELLKIQENLRRITSNIQITYSTIEALESILKNADAIRAKLSEVERLDREALQQQANGEHYAALTREIEGVERKIADQKREGERQQQQIELSIKGHEKTASLIDRVVCKGEGPYAECVLLREAISSRDDLPTMRAVLEQVKRTAVPSEERTRELADLIAKRNAVGYDAGQHKKLLEEFQTLRSERWDQKNLELSRAEGELAVTRNSLGALEKSLTEAKYEAVKHAVNDAEYLGLNTRLLELTSLKNDTTTELRKTRELVTTYAQKLGELQGKLRMIESARAEKSAIVAATEEGGRLLQTVAVYLRAVSRDGLPFLILESKLRSLQDYANVFVGEAPLRLEIEPLSGERKDSVVIRFYDDKGAHPLSEASGFQRMILGVSLSGALAKIASEMNGGKTYHVFIDEGFGAYRKENFVYGKQLLQRLADEFERVIFIADVPEIELVAESTLRVLVEPDGNRIEVA